MAEVRDLPLFAWAEAFRIDRARRRRLGARAALVALGIGALGATIALPPAPRLVWNASPSAPLGLYRVTPPARLASGDMVVAWLPAPARALAARRRYLPANVPAVKRIAAIVGARVCAIGATIRINGEVVATRLKADRLGRTLPWWHGCRTLHAGELLLLNPASASSFDGRYFGTSRDRDILGKAELLWAR
ncbi:MAG: S26 family signal peptidase [Sphingomonas sp.]|uniref:S26 family signal peptidase n=1 Tax=Sphingomonas sp. TaxID=28214 RepID=UPI001B116C83|nr:S26 family signal peptidase [Sphingomonas sp.]MBO9623943.1 S26 family signal peptidase [Sphingomonas sp.]